MIDLKQAFFGTGEIASIEKYVLYLSQPNTDETLTVTHTKDLTILLALIR